MKIAIEKVIPEKTIIVLCPHFDDLPLTYGGYFAAMVKKGLHLKKEIRVVNVFSRSTYQARDEKGNRDTSLRRLQYATGIRLFEDINCLDRLIGHGFYSYELKAERECVIRQKSWKPGEAFEFPQGNRDTFDKEEKAIFRQLKTYAAEWLSGADTALFCPLAVKEHVDHTLVRDAVAETKRSLGRKGGATVYFGGDQPYAGLADISDLSKRDALLSTVPHVILDYSIHAREKAALVEKYYPSQVEESYGQGVLARAKELKGCERIYRWS